MFLAKNVALLYLEKHLANTNSYMCLFHREMLHVSQHKIQSKGNYSGSHL